MWKWTKHVSIINLFSPQSFFSAAIQWKNPIGLLFREPGRCLTSRLADKNRSSLQHSIVHLWVVFLQMQVGGCWEKDVTSLENAAVFEWWIGYFSVSCSNSGSHIIHKIEGFGSRVVQVSAAFVWAVMTDGFGCSMSHFPPSCCRPSGAHPDHTPWSWITPSQRTHYNLIWLYCCCMSFLTSNQSIFKSPNQPLDEFNIYIVVHTCRCA